MIYLNLFSINAVYDEQQSSVVDAVRSSVYVAECSESSVQWSVYSALCANLKKEGRTSYYVRTTMYNIVHIRPDQSLNIGIRNS